MLISLEIDNYALIDHLEISFGEGFTAITGETGAGKSIILGALGLVLGNRADTQVLYDKTRKCIVEAVFRTGLYDLRDFFSIHEIDADDLTILRREINPSGKSRAFINDTPAGLDVMKALGERLVDIHSQHATVTLNEADFQLAVVDSFAGATEPAKALRKEYFDYKALVRKLAMLKDQESRAKTEEDYLAFLFQELKEASIREGEQEELEAELQLLLHAEEIRTGLQESLEFLSNEDNGIVKSLNDTIGCLRKIAPFHPAILPMLERLEAGAIDIRDIEREMAGMANSGDYDPELAGNVQRRLDLIYHLQKKHHVNDCRELLEKFEEIGNKLESVNSLEDQILDTSRLVEEASVSLAVKAGALSEMRRSSFGGFESQITEMLVQLGMPEARFLIRHKSLDETGPDGSDGISFEFTANRGHEPKPLSDIASGGELSRVMLSIKSMISQKNLLPTIIFDEIDSGISGDIAAKVGEILHRTSSRIQVIVITHLPQIAGRAGHHFTVYKEAGDNATFSNIRKLDYKQRVEELARLISGKEVTAAARAAAEELIRTESAGN